MSGSAVPKCVRIDPAQLRRYRKKDVPRHVIKTLDLAAPGQMVKLSTLEGTVEVTADQNTYVMIGPCSDVYPITREKFDRQYYAVQGADIAAIDTAKSYGWDVSKLCRCRLRESFYIYAKPIEEAFCVFVEEHGVVIKGAPGDFYAVGEDNFEKPYIIQADVMGITYEPEP